MSFGTRMAESSDTESVIAICNIEIETKQELN